MEISDIKQEPEEEQWDYKFSADANSYIKIEHTDEPDYVVISKDQPHLSDQGCKKETDFISIKNDENTSNVPFKIKSELKSEELDLKDEFVVKREEEDKADVQKNTLKLECAPSISGINNVGSLDKNMTKSHIALELDDDTCREIRELDDKNRLHEQLDIEECSLEVKDETKDNFKEENEVKLELNQDIEFADQFSTSNIYIRSLSLSLKHTETANTNKDTNQQVSYNCNYCSSQYKFQKSLIKHYKKIHNVDESAPIYKCNSCIYETLNRTFLILHEKVHKPKTLKCTNCTYTSRNKWLLSRHEKLHLNPEEAFNIKCDQCDYRTHDKHNLARHVKIHKPCKSNSSEKNVFHCFNCAFKSGNRSSFIQHTKTHMRSKLGEQNLLFSCDLCDYKSHKKYHIARHSLVHRRRQNSK